MLILKRNWRTPWRPVEKLIFVAFLLFSQQSCRGSPGSALFSSFHMVLWPRRQSQELPREPWHRTFLEFSRGSDAAGAIAEVAAEALAAHFSGVFMRFCDRGGYRRSGRGSPGSALFPSFHVVLWPRKLSQKWPRKLWQRTFLEFSRGSVAAEAIAGVAAGALAAPRRPTGRSEASWASKLSFW